MAINSDNLKAFLTIYEHGSFTRASEVLGLTQSALSQKIARLESFLEATLFIRKSDGLELTSSGLKLLPYTKQLLQTEAEFLQAFHSSYEELRGVLRIGGYSSVVRSLLIPSFVPFLKKYPVTKIEFVSMEMDQLIAALKTGKVDMILTDFFPASSGHEESEIGREEFVVIESAKHSHIPEIYLDHDAKDNTTEEFFKFQSWPVNFKRGFMGDVYGILDGVALGLGRAVMSRHLVETDKRFKIVKTKKRYYRPVVLNYFRQSYYTKLHQEAVSLLKAQNLL